MRTDSKPRFISYPELREYYGETRSRTQLRRDIVAGLYPAAKQVSPARIGWETRELDAHYNARPTVVYKKTKARAA
jgi:hypothetical protein